jgi:hypothetical protein
MTKSMQEEIQARFENEGERAFGRGAVNPYKEGTAAHTWWQRGNDRTRAYYNDWVEKNCGE